MLRMRKLLSTVLGAATLLGARGAFADTDPPRPCIADVKKLCHKVKAGQGAILACLEADADQVSSETGKAKAETQMK